MSAEEVVRGSASRAKVTPRLFGMLLNQYGIRVGESARDIGGSSNLNLLVDDQGEQYVVRVYRPWVTAARVGDMQLARQRLAESGVPCVQPIPALNGEGWITVDDRRVEVEPFVEHDAKMDSWERIEAGLPLLGQIHSILRTLELSDAGRNAPATNNIAPEDVLLGTARGIEMIRRWNPNPVESRVAGWAEMLARMVDEAQREFTDLPRQLVHGDYWDNNVLFRDGQVVLVADLDFMGERHRIDDLALTLYYTNSTFSNDPASDERIDKLLRLVRAYESGLGEPLTSAERAALPVALARTPLAFIAMIPAVDTERNARRLTAEMHDDVAWALAIAHDLEHWQAAFAL